MKANMITAFNAGEMTPLLAGRVDKEETKFGVRYASNFLPLEQGGLKKFYGTKRISEIPVAVSSYIKLIPFDNKFEPMVLCFCAGNCYCVTRTSVTRQSFFLGEEVFECFSYKQINDKIYFASKNTHPFVITFLGPGDSGYTFVLQTNTIVGEPTFPFGWSGNYKGTLYTDGYADIVNVSTQYNENVEYSLPLPTALNMGDQSRSVISESQEAALFATYWTSSNGYTYALDPSYVGGSVVELVRVRNNVETVVASADIGNTQLVQTAA